MGSFFFARSALCAETILSGKRSLARRDRLFPDVAPECHRSRKRSCAVGKPLRKKRRRPVRAAPFLSGVYFAALARAFRRF